MIQVDVQRGENGVVKVVLHVGELLVEQADVVVVDQRDGAHHMAVGRFPGLLHQLVADQVAEGFGAVGVAALRDQLVELVPGGR